MCRSSCQRSSLVSSCRPAPSFRAASTAWRRWSSWHTFPARAEPPSAAVSLPAFSSASSASQPLAVAAVREEALDWAADLGASDATGAQRLAPLGPSASSSTMAHSLSDASGDAGCGLHFGELALFVDLTDPADGPRSGVPLRTINSAAPQQLSAATLLAQDRLSLSDPLESAPLDVRRSSVHPPPLLHRSSLGTPLY